MVARINDIGTRYNRLVVLERAGTNKHNQGLLKCKCDCGNIAILVATRVRKGKTKSCGCLQQEQLQDGSKRRTHGMWGTPIYNTWRAMLRRCEDPEFISYPDYGAKGISVCQEWHTFEKFYDDMKDQYVEGLTIERLNSADNYYKENCTWIPRSEQPRNQLSNILSWEKAEYIRKLHQEDGYTASELAQLYNCSITVITNCLNNITWKK